MAHKLFLTIDISCKLSHLLPEIGIRVGKLKLLQKFFSTITGQPFARRIMDLQGWGVTKRVWLGQCLHLLRFHPRRRGFCCSFLAEEALLQSQLQHTLLRSLIFAQQRLHLLTFGSYVTLQTISVGAAHGNVVNHLEAFLHLLQTAKAFQSARFPEPSFVVLVVDLQNVLRGLQGLLPRVQLQRGKGAVLQKSHSDLREELLLGRVSVWDAYPLQSFAAQTPSLEGIFRISSFPFHHAVLAVLGREAQSIMHLFHA
mmetsp:Transcript_23639/g.54927  ORF Transcript_23639/g.54927 Transcript_23639/m.54927 type:complete len:256 (-) Transcript_23639:204-971(-)